VPEVLLSGHHEEIRRWRRKQALKRTRERRPDLLDTAALSKEDLKLYRSWLRRGGRLTCTAPGEP